MEVSVLRIGHRLVRDDRVTTHAALVARAFGAKKIYMTEVDESIKETVAKVNSRWGNSDFNVEVIQDWKNLIHDWKVNYGKLLHMTMYGINVDDIIEKLRGEKKVLVVIGAGKVPREIFKLAEYNIAIGNQPHSEIAALSIILDRLFEGKQLKKNFRGGKLKIIPDSRGKHVKKTDVTNMN
ncbi:MAG: tRNA (cytidine(56)-2'-O)-methyltransferase [Thermoproteota archaeon]|jgi:tRNA (cytidine56-2'-O)-methyltransferase|nr:tRNA (cytidine(56)-2'-O)-methyltransferase [Thermoproteota archaeon]